MHTPRLFARHAWRTFLGFDRDPRYLLVLFWAVPLFTLTYIQAVNSGWFDSVEKPIFHWINDWPTWLGSIMYIITQMGSLGGLIVWIGIAWYLINRRGAGTVLLAGILGWLLAKVAKTAVHRGRPTDFIHQINLFHAHVYSGFGFPSGHSTFSAACATVLYYQVRPRYRKYLLLVILLVGISRIYLGAHFPLDVVGGWALGAICGSVAMLLVGGSSKQISSAQIKRAIARKGYSVQSVQFVDLDARGSRPVHIIIEEGRHVFGKIFGEREHAADWLFKLYRFFRYKNLHAEEPYLNGRRNIELESFANLWARKVGARSPEIIDIVKVGRHWLLMQEQVDARPLPKCKRVKTSTLEDAWRQVKKLHDGNIAHRDLRSANLMVDKAGKVWIIDYGFAEVSPNERRRSMDIAELLMSMSLVVSVNRTIDSAVKVLGRDRLAAALPYVHRSVFSGATNQALRQNKPTLQELRSKLKKRLHVKGELEAPDVERINKRKLAILLAFAVFAYVIIPEFTKFKDSLSMLHNLRVMWLPLLALFSALTYIAAAAVFVILSNVPLKLREASMVQLASSFMSKIVPGGVGASGLNIRYLTKSGLETTEASALIVAQNAIGFITFIVPLMLLMLVSQQSIGSIFKFHIEPPVLLLVGSAVCVACVFMIFSRKVRRKIGAFITKFFAQLRDLTTSPQEIILAALASLAITVTYVACLYAALHAVHAAVALMTIVLVYASAMIAKSAVPTPGGLGPVEVAMSAALISAGLPAGQAFAAVILYRVATFWLPVPFSALAYRYVVHKQIV